MISKLITPSISCKRVSTMYTDTRSQCGIKAQMYIKCGMDAQKHNEPEHMLIIIYKPFIVTRRIVQHKMTLKLEVFMPLSPFLPCFRIRDSMCSLQQCHHDYRNFSEMKLGGDYFIIIQDTQHLGFHHFQY